jgi:tRNA 5-methylaminomethyl-2-thiouridine biosynthesis bifunctional protein
MAAEPLHWLPDGSPYSERFGDRYRSRVGGLLQAQGVFLAGCRLPQRWQGCDTFTVLETGFGLGLNFLVTWAAWRADPQRSANLHYVAVEAYPVSAQALQSSMDAEDLPQEVKPLAQEWVAQWAHSPGCAATGEPIVWSVALDEGRVQVTLLLGDVVPALRRALAMGVRCDAVYLDGFTPTCNPGMWSPAVMQAVAALCAPQATAASWCVAGTVRQALRQSGFVVHKRPGLPPKRHRLEAYLAAAPRDGVVALDMRTGPVPTPSLTR